MKKLLATASAAFGALPGVSVMLSEIGTPPDYGKLFGAIIQACGVLALVLLYFNRSWLSKFQPSFLTKWSIGLMISAFVFLADLRIISKPPGATVYLVPRLQWERDPSIGEDLKRL